MAISWAYTAGFLDGDGWVSGGSRNLNSRTRAYVVGFTQKRTEDRVLLAIRDFFIARGISAPLSYRNVKSPRVPVVVEMTNLVIKEQRSLALALEGLLPHLVLKRDLAATALDYTRLRLQQRGAGVSALTQCAERPWSDVETAKMIEYLEKGFSNKAIAISLGRSYNSVAQRLSRLGVTRARIANE